MHARRRLGTVGAGKFWRHPSCVCTLFCENKSAPGIGRGPGNKLNFDWMDWMRHCHIIPMKKLPTAKQFRDAIDFRSSHVHYVCALSTGSWVHSETAGVRLRRRNYVANPSWNCIESRHLHDKSTQCCILRARNILKIWHVAMCNTVPPEVDTFTKFEPIPPWPCHSVSLVRFHLTSLRIRFVHRRTLLLPRNSQSSHLVW